VVTRVLITGITGQDGAYLARLLVDEGAEVFGLVRRSSGEGRFERLRYLGLGPSAVRLIEGDVLDQGSVMRAMIDVRPDEVYNLAAQSFVGTSWRQPSLTVEVTGLGAINVLEAARACAPEARYYQASSSEIFGSSPPPQSEASPMHPRSPYGAAKLMAHWMTVTYRESYGMHASCGILFNHESPLRGEEFVTRKISLGAARIKLGLQSDLVLGNLDASRDWGHARDFVRAMRLITRAERPGDYVVATGEHHTVRQFCEAAFGCVDLDWTQYVRSDSALFRPAEVHALRGSSERVRTELGWTPQISFTELVEEMVAADYDREKRKM
jgi:GDPmannose 4,6-dehydratase